MDAAAFEVIINRALAPVIARLDNIDTRLDNIDTRLDNVETQQRIVVAKMQNSSKGRDEELIIVPSENGLLPATDYPNTLANLLVAGNEKLPNGQTNTWNSTKSRALIQAYDLSYETDEDVSESSERSCNRRLRLAKMIGITQAQLNFAQLTL